MRKVVDCRPVGTEQAEDTARLHLETDVVRRHEIPKRFVSPSARMTGGAEAKGTGEPPGKEGKLF